MVGRLGSSNLRLRQQSVQHDHSNLCFNPLTPPASLQTQTFRRKLESYFHWYFVEDLLQKDWHVPHQDSKSDYHSKSSANLRVWWIYHCFVNQISVNKPCKFYSARVQSSICWFNALAQLWHFQQRNSCKLCSRFQGWKDKLLNRFHTLQRYYPSVPQ